MALTDHVVEDGIFLDVFLDEVAVWPAADARAVSEQAVALTLFDPGQRRTPVYVERDGMFASHLARADAADAADMAQGRSPCAAVNGAPEVLIGSVTLS